ncbi:MAG: GIY-YIG nuclease family protein [Candidatus Omnitrophota bacterium]
MYTVYILRSVNQPDRLYIGLTTDFEKRLESHNADTSTYSKRYSPWELETHIVLRDKKTAEDLERYLKSGSGFAFLKKRLLPKVESAE